MGGCCSKDDDVPRALAYRETDHEDGPFYDDEEDDGACVVDGGARVRLGGSCRFASMFTQQGWKGVNQDAMTIWEDFAGEKDEIFCGVFDGHGPLGHKVASHVRSVLPSKLSNEIKSLRSFHREHEGGNPNDTNDGIDVKNLTDVVGDGSHKLFSSWKAAFIKAFEELDRELSHHATIDCICSGTTAVSIVKQREHLTIANLGDSRAVLCTRDETNQLVPVQLTVDLKPNVPSEEERIKSCRGRVFALEEEPDVHRLWLPDQDSPGLAMARAFGDFCLKDFGLIATPQVSYTKLSEKDEFVVLATDGVWDVLSNKEVVKIVSSAKRSDAASRLVAQAVRGWRRKHPTSKVDDCAVICLFLKPPPSPTASKRTFDAPNKSTRSGDFSFSESFKTARSEVSDSSEGMIEAAREEWTALEGVSRVNSLLKLPRFANVLSWRKKSVRIEEDGDQSTLQSSS